MNEVSILDALVEELKENPEGAIKLLDSMTNIVKPWESIKFENRTLFSSYRRLSSYGEELARVESNAPTWILTIQGERFTGNKVFNTKGAADKAMALLDEELEKRGFVLMDPKHEK